MACPADTVVYLRQLGLASAGISARTTPNLNAIQYIPATEGEVSVLVSLSGSATGWTAALNAEASYFL